MGPGDPKVPYLARLGHDETGPPTKIGFWENIQICRFSKILGMALPGAENVGVPLESILTLSRGSQLPDTVNKLTIVI